ncbi:hypothetical protein HYDPIDRAFT_84599 [Hydnomerulius pinastri MD-312]|nr:hypothetical protein HYDPIDRAFT_84599 [Hydnomerulius pinastri MD-312]
MSRDFGSGAGGTGADIVLNIGPNSWPGIFLTDKLEGVILAKMSGQGMVVFVAEYSEPEIIGFRDVDEVIGVSEINLGIHLTTAQRIKEVGDER